MIWMKLFIMATYAFQIILICFFPVPSAGSTAEMLFRKGRDTNTSGLHPARSARQSIPRVVIMISATLVVITTASIPMITIIFPPAAGYLFPFIEKRSNFLITASILCLVIGNALTCAAVRTLRAHATFHEFGETTRLHTSGIYGVVRNPITSGLALIFTGFVLSLPSAVMLIGFIVFLLNSGYRVKMEEIYLQRAFGAEYLQYRQRVGKYFPKIK